VSDLLENKILPCFAFDALFWIWIRIRIDIGRLDADPNTGGKKDSQKISQEILCFEVLDVFFLRASSCSMDVLHVGLEIMYCNF
jgi:hypothetical protein